MSQDATGWGWAEWHGLIYILIRSLWLLGLEESDKYGARAGEEYQLIGCFTNPDLKMILAYVIVLVVVAV